MRLFSCQDRKENKKSVLVYIKMTFLNSTIDALKIIVTAMGSGIGVWGIVNLLEGYGGDNPGSKSQGMKQVMANK